MNFQQQLADMKQKIEGGMPQAALDIMHEATKELAASGIQDGVVEVGDAMPAFNLPNEELQPVISSDLLAKGPLVITFYRGVWCPYCNIDLSNLNQYQLAIEEAGANMVAISPEQAKHSQSITKRRKLTFPILTDAGNAFAEQLGLRFTLPQALQDLYLSFGIDLKAYNGDPSWTLPMPARLLVDQSGVIRYAESSPDYTQRPDPDELMDVLATL